MPKPRRADCAEQPHDFTPREIRAIQRALLNWYRAHRRDLPWRRTRDPYAIWLSEMLLQQTRVESAIPYYERILAAFPTVADLAAAQLDELLKLWAGLGYYRRARHLHAAACAVVRDLGGKLPQSLADWRKLPGIGDYTAGAIASIAFDEPAPAVDGNIKRVYARLCAITESVDNAPTIARIWRIAEGLLPQDSPGDFNQALMELGARICTPTQPACLTCPVQDHCRAAARCVQDALPVRAPKKQPPEVRELAVAVRKGVRLLVVKRPERGLLAGLWELPARELDSGQGCAPHDVAAAFGVSIFTPQRVGIVQHVFTHRRLEREIWLAEFASGRVKRDKHTAHCWLTPAKLDELALATVDRKTLALVCAARDAQHHHVPATRSDQIERAARSKPRRPRKSINKAV